ncbi:MAG: alpha/beta hydrolase family protein, partial [Rhodanobacteraceae bacterium]
ALTLPAGEWLFQEVVLVGGSGPNDLDETVGGSKPFRDIANGLAAAGIASLRYDKRQTDYPLQMSANAHLTVDEEETDDALTAAHLLAKQRGINPHRVFVLGHSEGGMLVPRIGQRDPSLAGLILLAAPARKLLAVSRQQVREQGQRLGLPATQIHASEEALAAEQKLLDKADPKNPPQGEFGGAPQTWWLSLHGYDQVAVAKSLQLPMLILQGGSDFQVSPKYDFDLWKQALAGKSNVTFHLYPGLSHLFTPAGRTMTSADYAKPAHVDPTVIQEIDKWIKAQPAK